MVPANRSEGQHARRVPLSGTAMAIGLVAWICGPAAVMSEGDHAHIFTGPAGHLLSLMAMKELLRRMKGDDITVDAFRSSFRDWATERTSFPRTLVNMTLGEVGGHASEDSIGAAPPLETEGSLWKRGRSTVSHGNAARSERHASPSSTSLRSSASPRRAGQTSQRQTTSKTPLAGSSVVFSIAAT
jgi:hypothetical protein